MNRKEELTKERKAEIWNEMKNEMAKTAIRMREKFGFSITSWEIDGMAGHGNIHEEAGK